MTPVVSPPTHSHVSSTISPQASIQEEPEPEVVGAGLPLLHRLKIFKAKEENEKHSRDSQSRVSDGNYRGLEMNELLGHSELFS